MTDLRATIDGNLRTTIRDVINALPDEPTPGEQDECIAAILGLVSGLPVPFKTQAELDALKADWKSDPCWDIETTEGFEAYRTELLIFRLRQEITWLEERMKPLTELRRVLRDILGVTAIESRLNECFPEVH